MSGDLHSDKLCSGIVNGKVLNLELYTHRRQKLTLLYLLTQRLQWEFSPLIRLNLHYEIQFNMQYPMYMVK